MGESSHTYDVDKNLTEKAYLDHNYTPEGFTGFAGWATASNSAEVKHTDGKSVKNLTATANGTVNLYAIWTREAKFYSGKPTPPIPEGFVASKIPSEENINDGFVIYNMTEEQANNENWTIKNATYSDLYDVLKMVKLSDAL